MLNENIFNNEILGDEFGAYIQNYYEKRNEIMLEKLRLLGFDTEYVPDPKLPKDIKITGHFSVFTSACSINEVSKVFYGCKEPKHTEEGFDFYMKVQALNPLKEEIGLFILKYGLELNELLSKLEQEFDKFKEDTNNLFKWLAVIDNNQYEPVYYAALEDGTFIEYYPWYEASQLIEDILRRKIDDFKFKMNEYSLGEVRKLIATKEE